VGPQPATPIRGGTMGDPEAEAAAIGGADEEQPAQNDPAKELDSDAWFAEFLAENAQKLEQHNREAIDANQGDIAAAQAKHDAELEIARRHHEFADTDRGAAAEASKDAAASPYRREDLEEKAQQQVQSAAREDEMAAKAEAAAAEAEAEAKRLKAETEELYPIAGANQTEVSIRHQQARALERAAELERASQEMNRPAEGAGQE
jgi:hypothetical protein